MVVQKHFLYPLFIKFDLLVGKLHLRDLKPRCASAKSIPEKEI